MFGSENVIKRGEGKALCWLLVTYDENVAFVSEESIVDGEYLFPGKSSNVELEVDRTWKYLGANLEDALLTEDLSGHIAWTQIRSIRENIVVGVARIKG